MLSSQVDSSIGSVSIYQGTEHLHKEKDAFPLFNQASHS